MAVCGVIYIVINFIYSAVICAYDHFLPPSAARLLKTADRFDYAHALDGKFLGVTTFNVAGVTNTYVRILCNHNNHKVR